jgi:hypothetical protein
MGSTPASPCFHGARSRSRILLIRHWDLRLPRTITARRRRSLARRSRTLPLWRCPAAPPQPVPTAVSPTLSDEDRLLLAREELFARLTAELSPERINILSCGELAKVVDAAVQAHFVRNGVEPDRGRRGKGHGEPFRDAFGWAAASYHYTANSLRNAASIGRSAADVI